jgi:hypothetical protein
MSGNIHGEQNNPSRPRSTHTSQMRASAKTAPKSLHFPTASPSPLFKLRAKFNLLYGSASKPALLSLAGSPQQQPITRITHHAAANLAHRSFLQKIASWAERQFSVHSGIFQTDQQGEGEPYPGRGP